MPSQAEILNSSAEKYFQQLTVVEKVFEIKLVAFVKTLESKNGRILDSNENIDKVLEFKSRISEELLASGYDELVKKFIGEVPELIEKI